MKKIKNYIKISDKEWNSLVEAQTITETICSYFKKCEGCPFDQYDNSPCVMDKMNDLVGQFDKDNNLIY